MGLVLSSPVRGALPPYPQASAPLGLEEKGPALALDLLHVKTFRNVLDSTEVDDVTCLVGKNEAGKSAVLQALHNLNPANASAPLTLLDEYPRG